MNLLPFDPLSPRALSLLMLGLIILLSVADKGRGGSLVTTDSGRYVNCSAYSKTKSFDCLNGRNTIQGGNLAVSRSF